MSHRILWAAFLFLAVLAPRFESQVAVRGSTEDARPYWAGIVVPNADATAKWYQDNLQFKFARKMDLPEHKLKIVFLELNGFNLELVELQDSVSFAAVQKQMPALKGRDQLQGFVKLGFMVKDVDALAVDLKRKGVKLRMEPTDDPPFGTRFLLVEDNAGNLLQFFQRLK